MSHATPTPGEALAREGRSLKELTEAMAQTLGLKALKAEHLRLLGFEARSKNLVYLRRRLAWRLQELVEGGLSDLASTRLQALMPAELPIRRTRRLLDARPARPVAPPPSRDPRLPPAGTVLQRAFQGVILEVEVLESGFLYQGKRYASLSTLTREITGTAWNGYLFFHLMKPER